jgi:hypothetical protein
MNVTVTHHTDAEAVIYIDGHPAFKMRRRAVSKNLLGFWDLIYASSIGDVIVDHDQYRNDLVERCHRALQQLRFSVVCTEAVFNSNKVQWEKSLSDEFRTSITATYAEFEGMAILRQSN